MSDFKLYVGKKVKGSGEHTVKSILFNFKVLWDGWEMDNDAAIVELDNGEKRLLITDHGGARCPLNSKAMEFLANKSEEYLKLVADNTKAMEWLNL